MFLQALPCVRRYSPGMTHKLTPGTAALLVTAPLLWAGNAVVGRLVHDLVSPITLNFLRWALAFALLLPLAHGVLRPDHPVWAHWRRYALLGLLGIGLYNALQYMALQTSTPINVTLVGSSMPVWMLAVGAVFFGVTVTRRQLAGAALSMAGVLLVLSRGDWHCAWCRATCSCCWPPFHGRFTAGYWCAPASPPVCATTGPVF